MVAAVMAALAHAAGRLGFGGPVLSGTHADVRERQMADSTAHLQFVRRLAAGDFVRLGSSSTFGGQCTVPLFSRLFFALLFGPPSSRCSVRWTFSCHFPDPWCAFWVSWRSKRNAAATRTPGTQRCWHGSARPIPRCSTATRRRRLGHRRGSRPPQVVQPK